MTTFVEEKRTATQIFLYDASRKMTLIVPLEKGPSYFFSSGGKGQHVQMR